MVNLIPLLLCALPMDCDVLFVGTYCPPCHKAQRILKNEDIVIVNCNKDKRLARKYKIKGMPTFIVIRGGEEVARLVGLKTLKEYQEAMNRSSEAPFTGVIYFAGVEDGMIVKTILRKIKHFNVVIELGTAKQAEQYKITQRPTLVIIQAGKEIGRYIGS